MKLASPYLFSSLGDLNKHVYAGIDINTGRATKVSEEIVEENDHKGLFSSSKYM